MTLKTWLILCSDLTPFTPVLPRHPLPLSSCPVSPWPLVFLCTAAIIVIRANKERGKRKLLEEANPQNRSIHDEPVYRSF